MTSSGEINIRFGDNDKQFVLELLLARPRNFFAVIVLFFLVNAWLDQIDFFCYLL